MRKFQVMPVIKFKDGREKMNKSDTTGMKIFLFCSAVHSDNWLRKLYLSCYNN